MKVVGVLLVLWLALSIIGAVIEGLFWLTVVGVVLLVGTAPYGVPQAPAGPDIVALNRSAPVTPWLVPG